MTVELNQIPLTWIFTYEHKKTLSIFVGLQAFLLLFVICFGITVRLSSPKKHESTLHLISRFCFPELMPSALILISKEQAEGWLVRWRAMGGGGVWRSMG